MTVVPEPEPVSRAILVASDRLYRAGIDVDVDRYRDSADVVDSVGAAVHLTDADSMPELPERVQQLVQEQTAELVAVAALVRAANDERPLSESEIRLTRGFVEYIFNNIFRK